MTELKLMPQPKKPENMAEYFKAFRASRDLTQEQLALFLNVKRAYVSHLEQGMYTFPRDAIKAILLVLPKNEKLELLELVYAIIKKDLES